MEGTTVFDVLVKGAQDSVAIWVLAGCSVVSVLVIFSRAWYFLAASRGGSIDQMTRKVANALVEKNVDQAKTMCEQVDAPVARVFRAVLAKRSTNRAVLEGIMDRAVEREILDMERYIGALGTIGSVTPYIGLFGTVIGVMRAFHNLGSSGAAGHTVVMRGIAEALIATAVGLFVAIVAVVAYNYYVRKVKRVSKELQLAALEIVDVVAS